MDTAFVFPLFFAYTSHLSMNNWRDFNSGIFLSSEPIGHWKDGSK